MWLALHPYPHESIGESLSRVSDRPPDRRGILSFAFVPFSSASPPSPFHTPKDLGCMRGHAQCWGKSPDLKENRRGKSLFRRPDAQQWRVYRYGKFAGGSRGGNREEERTALAVTPAHVLCGRTNSGGGASWRRFTLEVGSEVIGKSLKGGRGD